MPSFRNEIDQRTQIFLNLAGSVEGQLREAYAKKYEDEQVSQSSIAERLGVNRSAINHRLNGRTNMTLKTVADMLWALGYCIDVEIYDPADRPNINHPLAPTADPAVSEEKPSTHDILVAPMSNGGDVVQTGTNY